MIMEEGVGGQVCEEEVPWEGDLVEDVALEFSPPRPWRRGRPRKKLATKRGME